MRHAIAAPRTGRAQRVPERDGAQQGRAGTPPFRLGGESIPVAFSAGVATASSEDRHPTDLLRRADLRLYEAKDAGRDRVAYPGWMDRRAK